MACNDDGCACLITSLPKLCARVGHCSAAETSNKRLGLMPRQLDIGEGPFKCICRGLVVFAPANPITPPNMSIRRCHHECDTGWRSGEAWLRKRGRTASILGVDEDTHNEERQSFAYWSGYTPGKRYPDGTLTPLNRDELRAGAARFRRGALRAREHSDAAQAARLEVTANDLEHRADQATED
jgi:hypothetical protein